jgi:hypothetical protein
MMSFQFRPPVGGQSPIFMMIAGGTNTGKSWSSLLIARGIVGQQGRIAAVDTESGRLTNLRRHHQFDLAIMDPPFTPSRFAEAAEVAEAEGYGALVIDSASMLHVGPGGYRDWHQREVMRLSKGDESKFPQVDWPARKLPSLDRQNMLYRMLQRRIPIIFSCRARELTEKQGTAVVSMGWQPVIHKEFIFDMTVGLTLLPDDGKGVIRHKKPFKIEKDLAEIFRDGDVITEHHGQAVMDIMRADGGPSQVQFHVVRSDGKRLNFPSIQGWAAWWDRPIADAPADVLKALRLENGGLMAEYAETYPDVVSDIQDRLDVATGVEKKTFSYESEVAS